MISAQVFATIAIYLIIQTLVIWLLALVLKNPSIVDAVWPIGIAVTATLFTLPKSLTMISCLLVALVWLWAGRLFIYLFLTRVIKSHVDKRYLEISENWQVNKAVGFLFNYSLQAILMLLVALPFYFTPYQTLNIVNCLGLILVCFGIIGETIADYQLQNHKRNHNNTICQIGLWRLCRHPNYFFDFVTWLGFACSVANNYPTVLAFISPFTLYYIFNYVTGPLTERSSIKVKGQLYLDYMKITPMFFPKLIR